MSKASSGSKLQPVRGTHDVLGDDYRRHRKVITTFTKLARRYNFEEILTPIFEFTEVFQRTLGETTDVVSKEMYTFTDKGGDSITLRPEPTAGIARAFISGGLSQNLPCKFFTHGPMFRYERPQKGRTRQFHQLDVEILGVAEPQADIEVLALGQALLDELGVSGDVTLELNTLGDSESRAAYRDVLVAYLSDHQKGLSEDSQRRLKENPLRILDTKDEGDRRVVAGAPPMSDSLNEESKDFFAAVRAGLDLLGIEYKLNESLVRGFDYYTHTAFEFTTTALGAQGTVIGGGRYDRLIEHMGGPPTPGIGWGAGIERLAMMLSEAPQAARPIAVVPVSAQAKDAALTLTQQLRGLDFFVDLGYRGNMSKRLKRANKINARAALILGEDELAKGVATLRDLDSGEQSEVKLAEIADALQTYR